jgi:hypothetical protein
MEHAPSKRSRPRCGGAGHAPSGRRYGVAGNGVEVTVMRGAWVAAGATVAVAMGAAPAGAAPPVEGYHDAGDRVGCVMYQGFDRHGNAVKCGFNGGDDGLLLRSAGAARTKPWSWPARSLGNLFFTTNYGQTLYLVGGTAKLDGTRRDLRCTFKKRPSVRVKCFNGDGDGIVVTRRSVRRISLSA